SGAEGSPLATITATATNPDASNKLTITQSGKPASLTFTAQAEIGRASRRESAGTPAVGAAGTYSIVFTVNDGSGATNATASSTIVLTIGATSQCRSIMCPATSSGAEGSPVATITATATDPDASNNLTITQSGKPASLTFTAQAAGPSPRTATITGDRKSTRLDCSHDESTDADVSCTNNATAGATNAPPSPTTVLTITATNPHPLHDALPISSGAEGSPVATITATATDPDASNNLTITQSGKPASLTFTAQAAGPSPRTATITGTPGFSDAGSYTIVWTVNDGSGATNATASTTTVLTIANTNQTPAICSPTRRSSDLGSPVATITATATDADATDNLTIT